MPQQAQALPDIHDDPEFHALPASEKHKVLMATDSDYRGMQPSEQAKALDEIHYGQLGRDQSQYTGGSRNKLADQIDKVRGGAENIVRGGMRRFGLPTNEQEADHFMGQEPGQKPALSEYIDSYAEAGKKDPVGYVPLIGPGSVSASEHVRKHEYGEAAGDLASNLLQVAPFKGAGVSAADVAGKAFREPGGSIRPTLRAATEIGGTVAGAEGMRSAGGAGPYIGAGIGYKTAPKLMDLLAPERKPVKTTPFRQNVEGTDWTPQGEGDTAGAKTPKTTPVKTDPFQGATSSAKTGGGKLDLPKPKLSAKETGEYLKSKGQSTGRLREDISNSNTVPASASQGKEKLSSAMQRKVSEAEGRYDARRMAETGALRDEDARTGRSLSDAVSDTPATGEGRPVSRKGQNLPAKKGQGKTRPLKAALESAND